MIPIVHSIGRKEELSPASYAAGYRKSLPDLTILLFVFGEHRMERKQKLRLMDADYLADSFKVYSALITALGDLKLGLLLSAIIHLANLPMNSTFRKDHEDFFPISIAEIQEYTGAKSGPQLRMFTLLAHRSLVEVKKAGIPSKRYIRINTREVEALLAQQPIQNKFTN
jgi:hypothetical protein